MLFNSFDFILFAISFFTIYVFIPKNFRYIFLLVASYYFYAYHDATWLYLIISLTIFIYFAGILISSSVKFKKTFLIITLITLLFVLSYFKYREFLYYSVVSLFNLNYTANDSFKIYELPLAISFFTFEFIHYIVDVYKGGKPIKNVIHLALFPAFFPTMIAGPIKRYQDFTKQLKTEGAFSLNLENIGKGLYLVIVGLFIKIVFADYICLHIVDQVYSNLQQASNIDIYLAMISFSFQIFYDFAGYSLIAIGLSKTMSIDIPINFNSPYLATNISDFWRRWHITLSNWLRDYVYIPLGGSREGKFKLYRNLFLTMLLGGLWHGAGINFIIWGMLHGIALMAYHYFSSTKKTKIQTVSFLESANRFLSILITFSFVTVAWVFFRLTHFNDVIMLFNRVLTDNSFTRNLITENDYKLFLMVAFFTFFGRTIVHYLKKINTDKYILGIKTVYLNILILFILMTVPLFTNPVFIYFKF